MHNASRAKSDQRFKIDLCLFSSTKEIEALDFVVKVLTGTPEELAECAVAWGYDGIEFLPNPEHLPSPLQVERALKNAGAIMPVVNSGRMYPQGMALLHEEARVRWRSIQAFKNILDFAGYFRARVNLGMARGHGVERGNNRETERLADDVFRELAAYAERAGAVIMLEALEGAESGYITTMEEARSWVERVASPAFTLMLDTFQLAQGEPSIEQGIRAARGRASHIHLYDPSRWPPGVLPEHHRLDWPRIAGVLREEGFIGSGSVVLAPEGDPELAARKSAAYLRRLFHQGESHET